jgi:acetyltransferase-like isoleucine patch superfamily enzyme
MAPHLSLVRRLPDRWRWRLLSALTDPVRAARAMGVVVGEDCRILSLAVSAEYDLISIGDRVTISSDVLFVTHDGAGWLVRDDDGRRHYWLARIAIGNDVIVGARTVIMPGIKIGDRCIVAAGSVVTRSVPDGSIVGGNPARLLRPRFPEAIVQRLLALQWWDWPVEKITRYAPLLTGDVETFLAAAAAEAEHRPA